MAIGMKVWIKSDFKKVLKKAKRATIRSLGHAAAAVRLTARRLMRSRKGPSAPGSPPNAHKKTLKKAILYAVERQEETAYIGPDASIAGKSGAAHEHGKHPDYPKDNFPKRPFMGPALKKMEPNINKFWAGAVR